jgi:hypothetical protein
MAKKGKDSRPTRQKQKSRSVSNKIKQMEKHVADNPKDKYGKEKLERAKKGDSRAARGVGPKQKLPELGKKSHNHRDRNRNNNRGKR